MTDIGSDSQARDWSVDPRRSIILQAPAGSGKTTVLTMRLLRLLAVVDEPEQILAITFTRKAAAEMRARVIKALRSESTAQDAISRQLRALAQAALERSAQRGWNLLEHPGRLRVQTIDSFNFWLASQLPVASRAGGALVVADRPDETYRRAARETLVACDEDAVLAADVALLFERLDNSWDRVERLLADMLQKRGHWLRHVLGQDGGALVARVSESLGSIVRDQLQLAQQRLSPALRAIGECVAAVGELGSEVGHLSAWQQLAGVALTDKGEWRKPRGVSKALGPAYEQAAVKEALKSCIEQWSAVPGVAGLLREIASLPEPALSADDSAAIASLSRVLSFAAAQLQVEFAAAGRVDHTYVAGAAREALTEDGEPTDLALRAGLTLRHILVDEFQDTSLGQFDLLEALTAGWGPGDGRTLFVVGDPMQSIYQFREAEVGLFLRARDTGIGGVRLEALRLTRNFRSVPALIAWANESFPGVFPPLDDLRASAVQFTPSTAAGGASGADALAAPVDLLLYPGGDRAAEASAIAAHVSKWIRKDAAASIAVLVASRAHAVPVMAAFDAAGIAAIGVDLVPLGELSIVRDLVALLRAMHHLGDRTAWLSVLRAPWCGVSLATLTELSRRDDPLSLWEAMHCAERLQLCEGADTARILRVRTVLGQALEGRERGPLTGWLEYTWLRLGAADAYSREDLPHAQAFFQALNERAASAEWRGPQDAQALLAQLYARPAVSIANPVQVMTIHKAKGLEFDHVFVPALDRKLNRGAEPLLRWLDLPRRHGTSDLILAPVPPVADCDGGHLSRYLKGLAARRAANERARLLYVAFTRARRSLHLSAAPHPRADGSITPVSGTLLATLWPVLGAAFRPAAAPAGGAAQAIPAAPRALRRLRPQWSGPEQATAVVWPRLPVDHRALGDPEFSWAGETLRHIGTVVHAALERLAALPSLPSAQWIADGQLRHRGQLRSLGVPVEELAGATSEVCEALSRTLADERGRWILQPTHLQAQSELAITGIAGGRLLSVSIDRSFVDEDGARWVIDFKTGRHRGADLEVFLQGELARYRSQMEAYITLARALGPQPVRAALYFPLLGEFRELAAAGDASESSGQ